MAVNKVIFNKETIIDISDSTVTADKLAKDIVAYDKAGEKIVGTHEDDEIDLQEKTVTPSLNQQNIVPDSGYDGLSKVIVMPMEKVSVATPTIEIDSNGLITATQKQPKGYVLQSQKKSTYQLPIYDGSNTGGVSSGGGTTEYDPSQDYQRVEYITSNREQYIFTDIIADNETGMEVIASYPTLVDRIAMGSKADASDSRFFCPYPLSTSSFYFGYNTGKSMRTGTIANTIYRSSINFLNNRSARVTEKLTGTLEFDEALSVTLVQQTGVIGIFCYVRGDTGVAVSTRDINLYSARISQGNEVIREYIPCYRKSDRVIGLYEKFTKTFLTNQGNGYFTKGPDVEWK